MFLSELWPDLNSLIRESFHWLLYWGWSVAFPCLMRVTLENSSYRPSSLGAPGALLLLPQGARWSLLKRFTESRDIRVGVFLWVSAGLAALMERLIHTDWLEITPCEAGRAQGTCPRDLGDGDAQVFCVQEQTHGVITEPAGMWGHCHWGFGCLMQPCTPLCTKCTPKGLQTLKIKIY